MKTQPFDLNGKVAIVTGGNGGIGLGMAQGLADAGAAIAVVGRNEAKSKAAAAGLRQRGRQPGTKKPRQNAGAFEFTRSGEDQYLATTGVPQSNL